MCKKKKETSTQTLQLYFAAEFCLEHWPILCSLKQ